MRPSSKRPVKLNPYWQPQADALYGETAFALAWLEPVWFEDARSVPDDWDPSLCGHESMVYWRRFWAAQVGFTPG